MTTMLLVQAPACSPAWTMPTLPLAGHSLAAACLAGAGFLLLGVLAGRVPGQVR